MAVDIPHSSHGYLDTNPNKTPVPPATFTVAKSFPTEVESDALTEAITNASKPKNQQVVLYRSAGT